MIPLYIDIPVFGPQFVEIAVKWTIPAIHAALANAGRGRDSVTFFIHTDDESAITRAVGDYPIQFYPLCSNEPKRAFITAHYQALVATPADAITVLFNADIVVCRNFFTAIDKIFSDPKISVMASLGLRTTLGDAPPIGAETQELMRWGWEHRHPLMQRSIYPTGNIPICMFFPENGSVIGHGFCLTPMAIRRDRPVRVPVVKLSHGREAKLLSSIDDGILDRYDEDEIYFICNGELYYVELSEAAKSDACDWHTPFELDKVAAWALKARRLSCWRNFSRPIAMLGHNTGKIHPFVCDLMDRAEEYYTTNQIQEEPMNADLPSIFTKLGHTSIFWGDRMMTLDKACGFLEDEKFRRAFDAVLGSHIYDNYGGNHTISWRLHTLVWAAKCAVRQDGDFVECGVFKGDMSWVVATVLGDSLNDRTFYLYDSFCGFSDKCISADEDERFRASANKIYNQPGLFESVQARFETMPNVKIVRGFLPESFDLALPERIAFLHIDLNSSIAELEVLNMLFDRVVTGGMIIFDDYGWQFFRCQRELEDQFMADRGYSILELPTGQGLVVK